MTRAPEPTHRIPGMLDTASLYEVLAALSFRKPQDAYPWANGQAIRITAALAFSDMNLKIVSSPGVAAGRGPSGDYAKLTRKLFASELIGAWAEPPSEFQSAALTFVRERYADPLGEPVDQLRTLLDTWASDATAQQWLFWMARHGWEENIDRTGSLVNLLLVRETAIALGANDEVEVRSRVAEIERLAEVGTDWRKAKKIVKELKRDEPITNEFAKVFLANAVLRGVYQDALARAQGHDIWIHPHRVGALPSLQAPEEEVVPSSPQEVVSLAILLLAQSHRGDRLGFWVHTVEQVRRHRPEFETQFSATDDIDTALARAADVLESLNIGRPKNLEEVLDWMMVLVPTAGSLAVSLLFQPWGVLGTVAAGTIPVGEKVARSKMKKPPIRRMSERLSGIARFEEILHKRPGRFTMPTAHRLPSTSD